MFRWLDARPTTVTEAHPTALPAPPRVRRPPTARDLRDRQRYDRVMAAVFGEDE